MKTFERFAWPVEGCFRFNTSLISIRGLEVLQLFEVLDCKSVGNAELCDFFAFDRISYARCF